MSENSPPLMKRVNGKHGTFLVPPNDIYIGRSLELYGEWCEAEVYLFTQLLKPGATVIEAGANVGSHTVPIARAVGPTGTVYAIEMQPFVSQLLSANVMINDVPQARVIQAGVGDTVGHLDVHEIQYAGKNNFGGISIEVLQQTDAPTDKIRVQLQPLDSLITVSRLDLLKLDVEHLELATLNGAQTLIETHRPVIYLENDDPADSQALLDFLQPRGYHTYWHRSMLFNPDNANGHSENVFGTLRCVNLLALPTKINVRGMIEATTAESHPRHSGL